MEWTTPKKKYKNLPQKQRKKMQKKNPKQSRLHTRSAKRNLQMGGLPLSYIYNRNDLFSSVEGSGSESYGQEGGHNVGT